MPNPFILPTIPAELQAIIDSEAEHVRPPAGAKELGWARLMAALPDGDGGRND